MSKFKTRVARIEATGRSRQVCVTFQVDGGPTSFQVPILLSVRDFDDTDMIKVARSGLHQLFAELAAQSERWKLSPEQLKRLSRMSMRPKP